MNQHDHAGPDRGAGAPTFEGRPLANPSESVFDQGLSFDLDTLVDRRHVLRLIGYTGLGAGLLALVGCNTAGASHRLSPPGPPPHSRLRPLPARARRRRPRRRPRPAPRQQ